MKPTKAADLLSELERLGLLSTTGGVSPGLPASAPSAQSVFPCDNIPFVPNPHFLCRDDEIQEVRTHLDATLSTKEFRSFALYGMGGIGKTQTALAFAHEQVSNGVEAVLWINCETGLSIARSFYVVAEMLQLEGLSQDENSDQNRFLVLKWLRKTCKSQLQLPRASAIITDLTRS